MIFYCGLTVHITDTRAQKVGAIHQRTLQKRCLHMTNTGRSKAVYPHHSCIVIRNDDSCIVSYRHCIVIRNDDSCIATAVLSFAMTMTIYNAQHTFFCSVYFAALLGKITAGVKVASHRIRLRYTIRLWVTAVFPHAARTPSLTTPAIWLT